MSAYDPLQTLESAIRKKSKGRSSSKRRMFPGREAAHARAADAEHVAAVDEAFLHAVDLELACQAFGR